MTRPESGDRAHGELEMDTSACTQVDWRVYSVCIQRSVYETSWSETQSYSASSVGLITCANRFSIPS